MDSIIIYTFFIQMDVGEACSLGDFSGAVQFIKESCTQITLKDLSPMKRVQDRYVVGILLSVKRSKEGMEKDKRRLYMSVPISVRILACQLFIIYHTIFV